MELFVKKKEQHLNVFAGKDIRARIAAAIQVRFQIKRDSLVQLKPFY